MGIKNGFVVATLVVAMGLTGCSAANKGGDTTCKEFVGMAQDAQVAVLKKHYEDKGRTPSNGELTLARMSAGLYCKTAGTDSSPIKNIDG